VHGLIHHTNACFLVSVDRDASHCVACKFDGGLSISVLRNEQLSTKNGGGLKTDQFSKSSPFGKSPIFLVLSLTVILVKSSQPCFLVESRSLIAMLV
jgi:hypothetical protein